MKGADPRVLLQEMISSDAVIPADLDQITLWKIILNLLTEPPKRKKLELVNTIENVVELIRNCKNVIVLTGAGVSVSCGIPDFRSKDGVYARLAVDFPDLPDPQAMFDIHYFRKDPRPFFKFAREIYPGQFRPSPCHRFIRSIEKHGKLLRNYTQNIDTLEQVVGLERIVQCHGSFATATCTKCKHKVKADEIKEDIFNQRIPFCKVCPPPPEELREALDKINDTSSVGKNERKKLEEEKAKEEEEAVAQASKSAENNSDTLSNNDPVNEDTKDLFGADLQGLKSPKIDIDMLENQPSTSNETDEDKQNSIKSKGPCPSLFTAEGVPGIMKPDIVFFGEGLGDEFHDSVAKDKDQTDLLIMIGSSLKVRPVALIPSSIPPNVPQVLINREPLSHLTPDVELLGDCDGIVNQLCHMLGKGWEDPIHQNTLTETKDLMQRRSQDSDVSFGAEGNSQEESNSCPEEPLWRPRNRISFGRRLPEGQYLYQEPSRYVFPGAEVYSDSEDDDSDSSSSSDSDSDSDQEESGNNQKENDQEGKQQEENVAQFNSDNVNPELNSSTF